MTCWHFLSTHFLRASLAVIFPVLTSLLRCWSLMVKRTVLSAVSSLWGRAKSEEPCTQAAATRTAPNTVEVTEGKPEDYRWNHHFYAHKDANSWWCLLWLLLVSHFFLPYRAMTDDQAPHLVYLTSWIWHSVSVSVSLSNTPSEVSLVDCWSCSWVSFRT